MSLTQLAHYSIRTHDLEATRRFYVEILGLRVGYRPPFNFPGLWLYQSDDESAFGVVHVIGAAPEGGDGLVEYLGDRAGDLVGSGALDHVAFLATDWADMRRRLQAHGLTFVERSMPALDLHQVFIVDPSGVTVELNYPSAAGWETP